MVLYFQKSFLVLMSLLFSLHAYSKSDFTQPDGWQFNSFFGQYKILQSQGDCKLLGTSIFVGKIGAVDTPSIGFRSVFSTDYSVWISLRTESYETCSSDHGEPCGGSAPDIWTQSSISGDGVKNAIFKRRQKNFNSSETTTLIEMVRVSSDQIFLKYNECVSQAQVLKESGTANWGSPRFFPR